MIKPVMTSDSTNFPEQDASAHQSVLMNEVLHYMDPQPEEIFVDGTLGMAGHALAILRRLGPKGLLIGLDRDLNSLEQARKNLGEYAHQCRLVHRDFKDVDLVLADLNIEAVNGILLDLGISSYQLDNPERGFSLRNSGPLDMRMDQNGAISAYDLVNSLTEKEIAAILKDFGEERWAGRIARQIVSERSKNPIEYTDDLTRIIIKAVPGKGKPPRIHPATRTFQALRIAVNRELETLEAVIDKSITLLRPGGRMGIISFHSLEDRIVKNKFKLFEKANLARCLVKKPVRPSEAETEGNPRARSARFRIIERVI